MGIKKKKLHQKSKFSRGKTNNKRIIFYDLTLPE